MPKQTKQIGVVIDLETFEDLRSLKREKEDMAGSGKEFSYSQYVKELIEDHIQEEKKKKGKK